MDKYSIVSLAYVGTLEDGTEFGRATADDPMVFPVGKKKVIPGFDEEIMKMELGEKRTFTVGQYQGYGEYNESLIDEIPLEVIPSGQKLEVGKRLWLTTDDGDYWPVTVVEIGGSTVKLDYNHPLAGKDLTFEVEILSIEEGQPDHFGNIYDNSGAMPAGMGPEDSGGDGLRYL